ncbi:Src kinase-associated phosphoprotein 1 [Hondaea fermentalgiana]|uniref:Src kinase-associated phosphoprotein 1 n=1 Tax=Hondaea fermentalgiana TaxID=2315210 RepID=A0A2R5FZM7_9STRA|nr:Src kinase-associated phosphoprotein 1 [Hondaea fermentalgiana]|eukprot:GBG24216.1 Src kinase-associated phosphoprotein 1 [Hondaea fermentalgiana]
MEAEQFAQPLARETWRFLCEALSPASPGSEHKRERNIEEQDGEQIATSIERTNKCVMLREDAPANPWQQHARAAARSHDDEEETKGPGDDARDRPSLKIKTGPDAEALERELIPVLKEGFLYKRKQKGLRMGVWNWQRRFCRLDNVDKIFFYGPQELAAETRGIPFGEIYRAYVSIDAGDQTDGLGSCREFCLELTADAGRKNASRTFVFRAQDPLDAKAWVRAFRSVSVQGQDWETRGRRISHVLEQKISKQRKEKDSAQASHVLPETETREEKQLEVVTSTFEIDVHEESKQRLKSLTERIIARAKERRRQQQRKKGEVRQALGSPIASSMQPRPSSPPPARATVELETSKLLVSCLPSCMTSLCVRVDDIADLDDGDERERRPASSHELSVFPSGAGASLDELALGDRDGGFRVGKNQEREDLEFRDVDLDAEDLDDDI